MQNARNYLNNSNERFLEYFNRYKKFLEMFFFEFLVAKNQNLCFPQPTHRAFYAVSKSLKAAMRDTFSMMHGKTVNFRAFRFL